MGESGPSSSAGGASKGRRLFTDERGFGIQIDFLTASTIYIGGWILFLALTVSLLGSLAPPETADKVSAERAADRLADDLFPETANDETWDRTCTEEFFLENAPGDCGYDLSWGSGDSDYLLSALNMESKNIHIEIRDTDGNIQSIRGTELELGDRVPDDGESVHGWDRQGALDYDGDGTLEWAIINVRVWS